jgi:predicted glycosyltransferase
VPHLDQTGVTLTQLPPLRSDGINFSNLLGVNDMPASPEYLLERQRIALTTLRSLVPDVLITELFPFGRKSLAAEFDAVLSAAHNMAKPPVILASIRDILAPPRKPKKAERADQHIADYYDGVLVHSDPTVTPLDISWPVSPMLAEKLHYTGFVAPPLPAKAPETLPIGEILVSAGGGSVGAHLFHAAIDAAHISQHKWRILIGGSNERARSAELRKTAPPNVIVEPVRPDFRQLLQHATCSVSLCGYNTALDILQTRCPAVFVPFDEGVEVEQSLRAQSLSERSEISTLLSADLNPDALLEQIEAVTGAPRPAALNLQCDGALRVVQIAAQMVEQRADV